LLCLGLAIDALGRDGASFEAFTADLFAASLADPVAAIFDSLERFLDLENESALSIADPEEEVAVGLGGGSVRGVGVELVSFAQIAHGGAGLSDERVEPRSKEIAEVLNVFRVHGSPASAPEFREWTGLGWTSMILFRLETLSTLEKNLL
jgi:hypothetical protein